MTTQSHGVVERIEAVVKKYVLAVDAGQYFAIALYVLNSYIWEHMDTCPYMVITAATKRSGKSRLGVDVLPLLVRNPSNIVGVTAPTLFRLLKSSQPTIIVDEAETFSSEATGLMRAFMNSGYRRGSTVPRTGADDTVEQWPVYGPKVFILIGDVNDTLKDRSIIVRLRRATSAAEIGRFFFADAQRETEQLRAEIMAVMNENRDAIITTYQTQDALSFLNDRDADIWAPLFAIARTFTPSRIDELEAVAVDMATEKTAPARKYSADEMREAEEKAQGQEYAVRLMTDMVTAAGATGVLFTRDAIAKLKALPTGPWRKYRGTGLTDEFLAQLLAPFGIKPKVIQLRKEKTVARGYRVDDLKRGLADAGVPPV